MLKNNTKANQMDSELLQAAIFEKFCTLAEAKDEKSIMLLIRGGYSVVEICRNEYTPVMLLAEKGKQEAVAFLINQFKARLNDAVEGAACGGDVKFTNKLISEGGSLNHAVVGASYKGHEMLVSELIERGADPVLAIRGAMKGGHSTAYFIDLSLDYLPRIQRGVIFSAAYQAKEKIIDNLILSGDSLNQAVLGAARGGHTKLMNKLIGRGASLDLAVQGAAQGHRLGMVKDLIAHGASLDSAVLGAASGGREGLVNYLIDSGASLDEAVRGAASRAHIALMNDLIARGASLGSAVRGAASKAQLNLMNNLIARGAGRNEALQGILDGGYLFEEPRNVLRFLSFIDNHKLRELLIRKITEKNSWFDAKSVLNKTAKLNLLIRKNKLTFSQAQRYLTIEINGFLFQGQQLVRDRVFPKEIYFHILSYVENCSAREAETHFYTANQRIRDRVIHQAQSALFSFFKGKKTIKKYEDDVEARYQKRIL